MKIVSPFKDYYDVVIANDMDPYPFYLRRPAEYLVKERQKTWEQIYLSKQPMLQPPGIYSRRDTGCVAFCGRLYPYWPVGNTYCYTLAQVVTAMKRQIAVFDGKPEHLGNASDARKMLESLGKTEYSLPTKYNGFTGLNKGSWDAWLQYMDIHGRINDEVFLREKAPVIHVNNHMVYINPNLRKLNFQTIMDPYAAYQEISMFLGNNLAQQIDPIPKTTDELRAHAHGYDKWSFRTHKKDSKKARKCSGGW